MCSSEQSFWISRSTTSRSTRRILTTTDLTVKIFVGDLIHVSCFPLTFAMTAANFSLAGAGGRRIENPGTNLIRWLESDLDDQTDPNPES